MEGRGERGDKQNTDLLLYIAVTTKVNTALVDDLTTGRLAYITSHSFFQYQYNETHA